MEEVYLLDLQKLIFIMANFHYKLDN